MKEEKVNYENSIEENAGQTVTSILDMATKDTKICFVKVAGRDQVKIPANSMKVIIGSTRQNEKGEEYTSAVQAIYGTSGSLPRNIMVIDTLGKVESRKKFDYTAVANRLRTVSLSNYGHPTGVVNIVYGPNLPTHRNSRVIKRTHVKNV